jgi:predicted DCC family thiol-disulfide oxidoreductase YuxK
MAVRSATDVVRLERVSAEQATPGSSKASAPRSNARVSPFDEQPQRVENAVRPPDGRPILLYNAMCETCAAISNWIKKNDASGRDLIDERPLGGDPSALQALHPDLDIWKAYERIHVLMPNGEIKTGGAAIAEVLKRLDATQWFAWVFDVGVGGVKPFLWALEGGYRVLDAIRPALGCSSCGGGPLPWWGLPIRWTRDAFVAVRDWLSPKS